MPVSKLKVQHRNHTIRLKEKFSFFEIDKPAIQPRPITTTDWLRQGLEGQSEAAKWPELGQSGLAHVMGPAAENGLAKAGGHT